MPESRVIRGKPLEVEMQGLRTEMDSFMQNPMAKALLSPVVCSGCDTPVAKDWPACPMCGSHEAKPKKEQSQKYDFEAAYKKYHRGGRVTHLKPKVVAGEEKEAPKVPATEKA